MALILLIDLIVVLSMLRAGRKRLENALPVFCFFLVLVPFESRLVIPGLFDLSTERVAVVTLLLMFLTRPGDRIRRSQIPFKNLMFLHLGWVICSTAISLSVATSTKQVLSQVVEYYLLYYMLIRIISDTETVYKMVYAMMIALSVCCVFGMLEAYETWSILRVFPSNLWTTYDGGHDPLYIEWGRGLRIRSTFPHPILFGDALAMGIPLTLFLLSFWKQRRQRFALWGMVVLMFWAVYKTSSRGPWIGVAVSAVMLFLLVQNRVRKYLIAIAVLALVALITRPGVLGTIENLYESTTDSSSPVGSSYQYRAALNDSVRDAVQKDSSRMIFGYGLGTFRELGLEIKFLNVTQRWFTCDNNWAAFLYETGYGGLLIIGALLLSPLLRTLRNYRRLPRPERYFSGVLFINLATFYFLLLSVAGYGWGQQGFMAWILISLSVVYPEAVLRERRQENDPANVSASRSLPVPQLRPSPLEAWVAQQNA
jgi:hypothetical protein